MTFGLILTALQNINRRLASIETAVATTGVKIMSALDDLALQVQKNADLEASAVQLIQGLAAQLHGAANDPARVQALASELQTSAAALAAAITANTPAAPANPPAPASPPTTPAT